MSVRLPLAFALALALGAARPAQAAERSLATPSLASVLPSLDLSRGLRLLPSAQLDGGALDFIPKGDLADDEVEWGLVLGQWASAAALSFGGNYLFGELMAPPEGMRLVEARQKMVRWSVLQLFSMPLVTNTGVFLVGNLSELHDVGFGWPLAATFASELILVGIRVGIAFGISDVQNDAVKQGTNVFGAYAIVDGILHTIFVPTVATYFAVRSRSAKGFSVQRHDERPSPALVAQVRKNFRSVIDEETERSRQRATPVAAALPVASLSF